MKNQLKHKLMIEKFKDCYWFTFLDNNRFKYMDDTGLWHLICNGVEVCSGISIYSYDLNRYWYMDTKFKEYWFKNGKKVSQKEYNTP